MVCGGWFGKEAPNEWAIAARILSYPRRSLLSRTATIEDDRNASIRSSGASALDGDLANYAQDEADLYWSVPNIADAIIELNERSAEFGGVDVIGHSLGGRGVAQAFQDIAYRFPDIRLGKVVLLAPDIDIQIFARLAPRIASIAVSF